MANKTQRVAVIGTGYFSQFHYDAWRRLKVNLVGVCSLDQKKARSIASSFNNCRHFFDFEKMIELTKPTLIYYWGGSKCSMFVVDSRPDGVYHLPSRVPETDSNDKTKKTRESFWVIFGTQDQLRVSTSKQGRCVQL